jgi:hypothetical protein
VKAANFPNIIERWKRLIANLWIKQRNEHEPFKPLVKTDGNPLCGAANDHAADAFNVQAAMVALKNDVQRTAGAHWQGTFQDTIATGYAHVLQASRDGKVLPDCST